MSGFFFIINICIEIFICAAKNYNAEYNYSYIADNLFSFIFVSLLLKKVEYNYKNIKSQGDFNILKI